MASTQAKAIRRADVLGRLSAQLGIQQADLHANAKGDPELALIMTLERVADAIEAKYDSAQVPVTVETVEEKPLETTETVQIVTVDLDAINPATGAVGTVKDENKPKPKGKK